MRTILLLIILLLPLGARCEENVEKIVDGLDIGALEELAGTDADVRKLILDLASGSSELDLHKACAQAKRIFLQEWRGMLDILPALMLPALICAVTERILGGKRSGAAARYLCFLACALSQTGILTELLQEAKFLTGQISELADAVFPMLAGLLSYSGATAVAAMLSPMAALLGRVNVWLFGDVGIRVCSVAAAAAIAGNLNAGFKLENLFRLLVSAVNWTIGLVMTGFVGLLSIQGLLGGGYDSASVRTARYAVDNLLPVIGGEVADTMDALVSSVLLVKNAAGVTGMLILLGICVRPLLRFAAAAFSLKLASAVLEPMAETRLMQMTDQIARVVQMLLTITAACVVLTILLLGAALTAGRGVVR